jgi:alkylation response protein AidB-like acyl-CoA dehydrogenase
MAFRAPVRDLLFSLTETAEAARLIGSGAFPDFDLVTADAVLTAAGRFAETALAPLNRSGDREGSRLENGQVIAPKGFRAAYRDFAAGGWHGLSADPAYGGAGLPKALEQAAYEAMHAANMAFGLCPMLTLAAIEALHVHGTEAQKALYMPRLVTGDWTGAMVLTEPQAGSDLGALRTTATPNGDGTYALNGQKIFITWGDHDLADNIVYFVLARLPDAPPGSRGISLFLTSKSQVEADGRLGVRNAVRPVGLEHKLGIHASPTCVMAFEGARAELVRKPNEGLAAMFVMMNAARLAVGVEGVAIAQAAWGQAFDYARERRQGRSAVTGEAPAPIFDHPDVRGRLALSRARIEAGRGICLSTAVAADLARHAAPAERERWKRREDLLVPIAKAWCTDMGVEVASIGVQVHGGMGFIEETGAAQHYRDARISPIYEGTNGIQAIDLIGRKVAGTDGLSVRELLEDIAATEAALGSSPDRRLVYAAAVLNVAADSVRDATDWMLDRYKTAPADALAGAGAYLQLLGDTAGGWMLAKGALAASRRIAEGQGDRAWLEGKLDLLHVYAGQVLVAASGRASAAMQGAGSVTALSAEALGG